MSKFLGKVNSLALFSDDTNAVIIDSDFGTVVEFGLVSTLSRSRRWAQSEAPSESIFALADIVLGQREEEPILASARLYTIPAGVQAEAKKALEWRKEHKRGGTPVGLNTARTLAKGGQIGIEKMRHIAKYFPRHEVDKKGKGWKPGEDNFPSNGRIAWALWGGDAGQRWATAIVKRENNKAIKADGYQNYEMADLESFKNALMFEETVAPEFIARVRLDGSGIDRIYKINVDGQMYVWDDGTWDKVGATVGDIWYFDKELDDPEDTVEKSHIEIDPESAILICAKMQSNPFTKVSVFEIDSHEASLVEDALEQEDWGFVDHVVTAAVPANSAPTSLDSTVKRDGNYTPEERAKNASKQVRDGSGKFAKQGGRVRTAGNRQGTVKTVNVKDQSLTIAYDDGATEVVPASNARMIADEAPSVVSQAESMGPVVPLNTQGILGQPRTPIDRPNIQIPGTLPALGSGDMASILGDWDAWVAGQRASYKPQVGEVAGEGIGNQNTAKAPANAGTSTATGPNSNPKTPFDTADRKYLDTGVAGQTFYDMTGYKLTTDAYSHPLLKDWLGKTDKSGKTPNSIWYQPITSAGDEKVTPAVAPAKDEKEVALTPATSDVQPLYFAIVAPDDLRAVTHVICVVPETNKGTAPTVFERLDKKWVKAPQIMADLKSATPPSVVPLNSESLNSVLLQADGVEAQQLSASAFSADQVLMVLWGPEVSEIKAKQDEVEALFAAGGLDRNKGNAEALRRYWTRGKGAAKIRWGTEGDWKRCVRNLSKYLGVRAKGYCQLRHIEVTGVATGSRRNPGNENAMEEVWGDNIGSPTVITEEDLLMPVSEMMREQDDIYDHHWEPEEQVISMLKELAECSDEEYSSLTAAGGLDRNRGNAEELRQYWTVGKGASKIRWGTGGDWTRCVRNLSKYMGPRSKGYCALRHKEMNGVWTGDKKHRQMYSRTATGATVFSNQMISSTYEVITAGIYAAEAKSLKERFHGLTASGSEGLGPKFRIPLVIPENLESGDGRKFKKGAIEVRDLPLPLMWQIKTGDGHSGSVVVGRIDHMERTEDGIGNCYGYLDTGEHAKEVARLIKYGFIKGVSADMDRFEATQEKEEASEEEDKSIGKDKIVINKARVMGITIVPKPAFQECKIYLEEDATTSNKEEPVIQDGIYADDADPNDAESLVACGFVAGAIPLTPPTEWFENPNMDKPTPLTIDETGRVYGHIAAWHVDHIGLAFGTKPPRSRSNYAYFHTGVIRTEEGKDMPVGQLTLAGGHASLEASASEAVRHYDDTASAFADVHAGEDRYGIWVAGALRPGVSPEQIRAARATAPSGDWRPIRNSLELVAVCQVNVPGFPVARARVASGAVMALVAAGASTLAKMKSDPMTELAERVQKLESMNTVSDRTAELEAIKSKFAEAKADIEEYGDFAFVSKLTRMKLAKQGQAMKDGSFPIRNVSDLKNAIQAYGRASDAKKASVKEFIKKRARALKKTDLIPENWEDSANLAVTASVDDLRSRIASVQDSLGKAFAVEPEVLLDADGKEIPAVVEVDNNGNPVESGSRAKGAYTPQTQPRDEHGKFRKILARLTQDLGTAGLQSIVEEARTVDNLHEIGDYSASAKAATKLLDIVDRLDAGALNKISLENVRSSAAELGKVISNLPLGFNNQADKLRYTDLPPALRDLMDDMITRVEDKIGKKDADEATKALKGFKSGSDVYSQAEISSQMSKLLRLLT